MLAALVQGQVILLMMKVMKVKGLVTVKVLLEVKVLVLVFVLLKVSLLKALSLASPQTQTTMPQTRPAARVEASGAKGLGLQFAAPAPGRRCSGPFFWNTAPAFVRHGVG